MEFVIDESDMTYFVGIYPGGKTSIFYPMYVYDHNVGGDSVVCTINDISRNRASIIKIRRMLDCLIFMIGVPTWVARYLHIETPPAFHFALLTIATSYVYR